MEPFEQAKERIKERIDLAELVQRETPVQRRGRYFVALCPFHNEKSPSFTIYPDSQRYKCYGCGVSGDVFTYLVEREGINFREAMERLAEEAQVSLEGVFGQGRRKKREGPDPFKVLEKVRDWYEEQLWGPDGQEHRDYLESRGLLDVAEEFGLGAHPARPGAFGRFAEQERLDRRILEQAGLRSQRGGEAMQGRVMFPIADDRGRIVGFGGRVLPDPSIPKGEDRRAKYRNSPESEWFSKRRLLYGLRQAKRSGVRKLVVVEGYTDVVALHLAGFTGAVATLGTALTEEHARLLQRYATEGLVLLFDGDQAGRRAADRAFRELVNTPLPVRIGLLEEGADPADLAAIAPGIEEQEVQAKRGRLTDLVEEAPDALTVWFRLWRTRVDLGHDAEVQRVAGECGRILGQVEDRARRESLRTAMATQLGISERAIEIRAQQRARNPEPERAPRPAPRVHRLGQDELRAADLLACVLKASEFLGDAETLLLPEDPARKPLEALKELHPWEDPDLVVKRLLTKFGEDSAVRSLVDAVAERSARLRDPRGMFAVLRRDRTRLLRENHLRRLRAQYHEALSEGNRSLAQDLLREWTQAKRSLDTDERS